MKSGLPAVAKQRSDLSVGERRLIGYLQFTFFFTVACLSSTDSPSRKHCFFLSRLYI